jgi:hypothetical protein
MSLTPPLSKGEGVLNLFLLFVNYLFLYVPKALSFGEDLGEA